MIGGILFIFEVIGMKWFVGSRYDVILIGVEMWGRIGNIYVGVDKGWEERGIYKGRL